MAKQQSFADKAAKANMKKYQDCEKCGGTLTPILMISSEKQPNGAYKFRHNRIRVCKCNEKTVYA